MFYIMYTYNIYTYSSQFAIQPYHILTSSAIRCIASSIAAIRSIIILRISAGMAGACINATIEIIFIELKFKVRHPQHSCVNRARTTFRNRFKENDTYRNALA